MARNDLPSRVQERLNVLGKSALKVAEEAGLERGFINDVLIGRKRSIRPANLEKVARALDCDPDYLTGHQGMPHKPAQVTDLQSAGQEEINVVPIVGICETGVWRSAPARQSVENQFLPADPAFVGFRQAAYVARGDGARAAAILDGDAVTLVDYSQWVSSGRALAPGMLCVVERIRKDLEVTEVSIRKVSGDGALLEAPSASPYPAFPIKGSAGEKVEILGVVNRAIRRFL